MYVSYEWAVILSFISRVLLNDTKSRVIHTIDTDVIGFQNLNLGFSLHLNLEKVEFQLFFIVIE